LIAGLRVFGFATEWLPAVEMAFIDGLSDRLPWKKLRIPRPVLLDRQIETCEGLGLDAPSNVAAMNWLTPVDAENIDLREKAGSVITRLHRRLAGLAYWHDCALGDLEPGRIDAWQRLAGTEDVSMARAVPAYSGAQKKIFRADAAAGRISLSGDLTPFWPLLLLGERCGVGRGAARGRGRFSLAKSA